MKRRSLHVSAIGDYGIETVELPLVDDQGRTAMILRGAAFSALTRGFPEEMEFEPLAPPEA